VRVFSYILVLILQYDCIFMYESEREHARERDTKYF